MNRQLSVIVFFVVIVITALSAWLGYTVGKWIGFSPIIGGIIAVVVIWWGLSKLGKGKPKSMKKYGIHYVGESRQETEEFLAYIEEKFPGIIAKIDISTSGNAFLLNGLTTEITQDIWQKINAEASMFAPYGFEVKKSKP